MSNSRKNNKKILQNRQKSSNFALFFRKTPIKHVGDSLAQLVEHNTFNVGVVGSSPTRITEQNGKMPQIAETKTVSAIFVMSLSGKITHIVGFRGVQFVNSPNREQFCSRFPSGICNHLIFCVFLRFAVLKVGLSCYPQGSKPHFSGIMC